MNENWTAAMSAILHTLDEQSQGTWTADWQFVSHYNWTGTAGSLSPPVPNSGNGEPRAANGLVASSHRPSDDLVVFPFITSDNAMMAVELRHVADILESTTGAAAADDTKMQTLAVETARYARVIRDAVWNHTRTAAAAGDLFAYETNGYGGMYLMDDANVPSLVSLPYLGFLDRDDATYQATKKMLFSRANPYYAAGAQFNGIG